MAGQVRKTSLVQMESPWKDQGLEHISAVILLTVKNLSLVLDLMEDHSEGQIHRTPLDLALVLMENPWEDQGLEDRSVVMIQTGWGLSPV